MQKKILIFLAITLLLAAGVTVFQVLKGWEVPSVFEKSSTAPATPPSPQDEKKTTSTLKKVRGREIPQSRARVEVKGRRREKRQSARFSHAQQVGENLWAVVSGPFQRAWTDSTARALWRARVNVRVVLTRQEGGYLVLGAVTERQAQVVMQKIAGKGVARKKIFILPPKEKL